MNKRRHSPPPKQALLLLLVTLSLLSTRSASQPAPTRSTCLSQASLICVLTGTTGHATTGIIRFRPIWRGSMTSSSEKCSVLITGTVSNLPAGAHGMHVHTYGDASSTDGTSAGGHFVRPGADADDGGVHGFPRDEMRHWGDFGNVRVGADGVGRYRKVDRVVKVDGLVGRAVVVHAGRDKGKGSQPSGDAGERVGVCVIGYANAVVAAA